MISKEMKSQIIEKYKPDCASVEQLFFFKNQKTIIPVAEARGVILTVLEKYNIPLHEYDLDYKFHTTLFMDDDWEKVKQAYRKIRHMKLPARLTAERFVIGVSASGALGTYRIYKTITKP